MIRAERGDAVAYQADATREEDVRRVVVAAVDRFGPLDILHNNVGASIALGDAPADTLTEEAFDRSFAVNLKTAWLAPSTRSRVQEARPRLDREHLLARRSAGIPAARLQDNEGGDDRHDRERRRRERAVRHTGQRDPPRADEHADGDRVARGARPNPREVIAARDSRIRSGGRWVPGGRRIRGALPALRRSRLHHWQPARRRRRRSGRPRPVDETPVTSRAARTG